MRQPESSEPRRGFTIGYDLGTVGAWVRIVIGVIASLALLVIDISDADTRFLVETALWFVGVLAAYTLVYVSLSRRILGRLNPWISTVIFYGSVLVLPYVESLPSTFRFALALYVTVSIAVVVFIRYGGCEVVGIPSLLVRRRHVVYCPWNTVDLVDKAIEDSRWSASLQAPAFRIIAIGVLIAVVSGGALFLGDVFPVVWLIVAAVAIGLVAVTVGLVRAASSS